MNYKRIIAVALCLIMLFSFASCGTTSSENKLKIAVISKAIDTDFWHNVKSGVDSAAIEYNVSVTFEGPENEDEYEKQNEMIEKAISNKVDAIVLSAINYYKSVDSVEKAVRKGIKVVTIDSDVGSQQVSMIIGT